MYWYNRYAPKIVAKRSSKQTQRVLINGQCSSWAPVFAGVPQSSVLGPLLFLIYVTKNYLLMIPKTINQKLFADDTFIFFYCK